MKNLLRFSVVAVTLAGVLACGESSSRYGRRLAVLCPAGFAPISMDGLQENQKLEKGIPEGTYTYNFSDIYYQEKNSNFAVYIRDSAMLKEGEARASVTCGRGIAPGDEARGFEVPIVTGMKVEGDKVSTFDMRTVGFAMIEQVFQAVSSPKTEGKPEAPKDAFTSNEVYLVKLSDFDYEIRARGEDDKGSYWISVKLRKAP